MLDGILVFGVYLLVFILAAVLGLLVLGVLLIIDLIFDVNYGRRLVRWVIRN